MYRESPAESAGRGGGGGAGAAGRAGRAGRGGGDVCTGVVDGATLATSILEVVRESVSLSCETDADCDLTPVLPRCDPALSLCVGCPDLAAKIVDLTACLADARDRCCNSPQSPVDCIYRDCVPGCDGQ